MADGKSLRSGISAPPVADGVRPARLDAFTPVGDQLRTERERRAITLAAVAEVTKIRRTYLLALERNDWDALPAEVFGRGYLRSYAEHLGMDAEHLLRVHQRQQRLRRTDDAAAESEATEPRGLLEQMAKVQGVEARSRKGRWIASVVVMVGIAIAASVYWTLYTRGAVGAVEPAALVRPVPPAAQRSEPLPPPESEPSDESTIPEAVMEVATPVAEPQEQARAPRPTPRALTVSEFGFATDVAGPTLAEDRFAEGTLLWFRASVHGGRSGEVVRHVWLHGDRPVAVAPLQLHGEAWPTASRLRLLPGSIGTWTVEARDAAGGVLARARFTCTPAATGAQGAQGTIRSTPAESSPQLPSFGSAARTR